MKATKGRVSWENTLVLGQDKDKAELGMRAHPPKDTKDTFIPGRRKMVKRTCRAPETLEK